MAYQVLARKWRPQRFADVLGQSHITRTLQNAIEQNRVGHGYLFVGPRGIGKTTSARIFAKALNCPTPTVDADGGIEPCCSCSTCAEIAAGNCLDVLEIDGASHNKVEDIRELREGVQYAPTNGRKYKIYIIDEVHMLTTQAWNALLKTLEEPPPHVKFLFATTEAHKVLATIVSRCQRFDLKPIDVPTIVERLRQISVDEKIHVDEEALTLIARAAEGGMRDAQSIFDQMISFCGGLDESQRIRQSDVVEVFGLSSSHELQQLTQAMLANDATGLLEAIHALADKGRDLERLYADVLGYLRNVMIFQLSKDPARIVDLSETERAQVSELATGSRAVIQRLIDGLMDDDGGVRLTLNKRLYIEATLLRVMRDAHAVRIDDLLAQLQALQQAGKLDNLPPAPPVQQMATAPPAAPAPAAPPEPPVEKPIVEEKAVSLEAPAEVPKPEVVAAVPEAPVPPTAPAAAVAPPREQPVQPTQSTPPEATQSEPQISFDDVRTARDYWLDLLAQDEDGAQTLDEIATPVSFDGSILMLSANQEPGAQARQQAQALGDAHDPVIQVEWSVEAPVKRRKTSSAEAWEAVEQNPFVQSVCELFGGRVVDVRG